MAEEAPATAPSKAPAKAPAKAPRKKKASGAKTEGPSITKLIIDAVTESKERKGTSAAAIKKYLADKGIDVAKLNKRINKSLTSLVEKGALTQVKGAGASGSFKLAKKDVKPVKPKVLKPKTPVKVRKPVAKKNRPVKKQAAKKPAAAAAKKVSKKSSPKKTVKNAKSPKRTPVKKEKVKARATATKTKRSPVKKVVKKSTAKKSAAKKTKK